MLLQRNLFQMCFMVTYECFKYIKMAHQSPTKMIRTTSTLFVENRKMIIKLIHPNEAFKTF